MRLANTWIDTFLPNAGEVETSQSEKPLTLIGATFKRIAERALADKLGERIEQWEMRRKIKKLAAEIPAHADGIEFSRDVCRGFFSGHGSRVLRDVQVVAELPVAMSAYRRQQQRWGRGSLECALKLLPCVWQADTPWQNKIEATLHLTGYGIHLLMFVLMLLYPVIVSMSARYPGLGSLFGIALICNATAFAPTIFFIAAQEQLGRHWWQGLGPILLTTILGTGMMVNTTRAALQIITHPHAAFERTPKFGIARKNQNWRALRYQLRLDSIVYVEVVFALFNGWTLWLALQASNFAIALYALLFAAGMLFTSGITIAQSVAVRNQQNFAKGGADTSIAPVDSD